MNPPQAQRQPAEEDQPEREDQQHDGERDRQITDQLLLLSAGLGRRPRGLGRLGERGGQLVADDRYPIDLAADIGQVVVGVYDGRPVYLRDVSTTIDAADEPATDEPGPTGDESGLKALWHPPEGYPAGAGILLD